MELSWPIRRAILVEGISIMGCDAIVVILKFCFRFGYKPWWVVGIAR